jgi:hypothetical protein
MPDRISLRRFKVQMKDGQVLSRFDGRAALEGAVAGLN